MKLIRKYSLLLAALFVAACSPYDTNTDVADGVSQERNTLTQCEVYKDTLMKGADAGKVFYNVTLMSENVSIGYDDAWAHKNYYGSGAIVRFNLQTQVDTDLIDSIAAGVYYFEEDSTLSVTDATITYLHAGSSASSADTYDITSGTIKVTESKGEYAFVLDCKNIIGTDVKMAFAQKEVFNPEFYWYEKGTAETYDWMFDALTFESDDFDLNYDGVPDLSFNKVTISGAKGRIVMSVINLPYGVDADGNSLAPKKPEVGTYNATTAPAVAPLKFFTGSIYEGDFDGSHAFRVSGSDEYDALYHIDGGEMKVSEKADEEGKMRMTITVNLTTRFGTKIVGTYAE